MGVGYRAFYWARRRRIYTTVYIWAFIGRHGAFGRLGHLVLHFRIGYLGIFWDILD